MTDSKFALENDPASDLRDAALMDCVNNVAKSVRKILSEYDRHMDDLYRQIDDREGG